MSSRADLQLYQVSGLWCSSCARALQFALGRMEGVAEASVDFVTHTLNLKLGSDGSLEAVRVAAEKMGYRIEPYQDLGSLRRELTARTRGELMRFAWVGFFAVWTMVLALIEYTEVMGPLSDVEFRWLAIAMGGLAVTGIFGGAYKVYLIGLSGLLRLRPSIDSLLVATSLSCLLLSFYHLWIGDQVVYFDSAIMVIAVVLGIRAGLAFLSGQQLDVLYRSLQLGEPDVRVLEDGGECWKPVQAIQPGYRVRVSAGELVAVDGRVMEGAGSAQSALFTGEADPVPLGVGSEVVAGEVLLDGELWVEVTAYFGERQVDRLGKRVLASFHEEKSVGIVDTFLAYAAPVLMGLSLSCLFVLLALGSSWESALPQALSVMIVACPCALFFCRPLPLIRAQLTAEREGLTLLRPSALHRLGEVKTVAFDKTGTLTCRAPLIELVRNDSEWSDRELWSLLAGAELGVQHPVAYAVQNEVSRLGLLPEQVENRRLLRDGVRFEYKGKCWQFGRSDASDFVELAHLNEEVCQGEALFRIRAEPSEEVAHLLSALKGSYRLALLSGDREESVRKFEQAFRFDKAGGDLNPEGKAREIRALGAEYGPVLYCGDGYNDVEALGAASVAVCVPHAPAAVRLASDVQLQRCDAKRFGRLFALGRQVARRYRQNLVFASCYNVAAVAAAFSGVFAPWVAALAMASAAGLVLLNSMR